MEVAMVEAVLVSRYGQIQRYTVSAPLTQKTQKHKQTFDTKRIDYLRSSADMIVAMGDIGPRPMGLNA